MDLKEIVLNNRSYRRFDQSASVSVDTLTNLVDMARQTPSAGNKQALRYLISADTETNARIFATLAWAGALPDWPGPEEGERPPSYIAIAIETAASWEWTLADVGIAAQTILLGAVGEGLGGCMIGSFKKNELSKVLEVPEGLDLRLVIPLGKPVETVTLEPAEPGTPLAYYRTPDRVHHVPKRKLSDILVQVYR